VPLKWKSRILFEFAHLQAGGVKAEEIEKLLEGADEEKKRTIMKIIRAVGAVNAIQEETAYKRLT